MKVYTLKRTQVLRISLNEAWNFFSSPANLTKITPAHMSFKILYQSGSTMYAGQLIRYSVNILPLVTVHWLTEITHVEPIRYFVDEQRSGPYALWHHQHWFNETSEGIEVVDEVNYAVPFGILGRLINRLFVWRRVNAIFDYRKEVLNSQFHHQLQKSA